MSDISVEPLFLATEIPEDIPKSGLAEALRSFGGRGGLLSTLTRLGNTSDQLEREWSEEEILRRARRVLFSHLEPLLVRWPTSSLTWLDNIPAEFPASRTTSNRPTPGTSWRETRVRGPWPPREFHGRSRTRALDEVLIRVLGWTIGELKLTCNAAIKSAPGCDEKVSKQLQAANDVADALGLNGYWEQPDRTEISAVRREGAPWVLVADVASTLSILTSSVEQFANELLIPDPSTRGLLFHLAALGVTLEAAKKAGWKVTSVAPLSDSVARPNFILRSKEGKNFELWFEGGGAWRYHKMVSPYATISRHLPGNARPISPDILLLGQSTAISVECKYSNSADYIRSGVQEALAYSADLSNQLATTVKSLVVVPDSNGILSSTTEIATGILGLFSSDQYAAYMFEILESC